MVAKTQEQLTAPVFFARIIKGVDKMIYKSLEKHMLKVLFIKLAYKSYLLVPLLVKSIYNIT